MRSFASDATRAETSVSADTAPTTSAETAPRGDDDRTDSSMRPRLRTPGGHNGGVDPVDALREVAFWLEREHADTYRVQAYRRAAEVLAEVSDPKREVLRKTDSWTDLPGVGKKTATVIRESFDGVPAYLEQLREEADPIGRGGRDLLESLRGDLHTHSNWSDGGSPIDEMHRVASTMIGHEYFALTDHSPRLKVANGLTAERLRSQLAIVAEINENSSGARILAGIEVDILDDGSLDQDEGLLAELDVVVASVHSNLRADRSAMTKRMLRAAANPHVDVLGHCTGRLVAGGRGSVPSRSSTPRRSSPRVATTTPPSRSTAGPNAATRRHVSSTSRSRRTACSPSTPMRTHPGSSTGSGTVANVPSSGVSNPNR